MQRRLLAAVAAFLIAAVGAVVLVGYVNSADARAQAGEQLVPVLVVTSPVPAGTDAAALAGSVSTAQVPARLAAPGRVAELTDLTGRVTTAALLPGEQVLAERFVDPSTLLPAGTVAAPAGTQEVSLSLQPQQAVNGAVKAGDRVGVLVFGDGVSQVVDDVLVTRSTGGDGATTVTVTLALDGPQSTAVIAGMQDGTVWLSLQEAARPGSTPGTVTPDPATTPTTGEQA
ncbi:hypothetical protein GB931_06535 [Modestobacter sp. I12A-02628]|uniref:SAF domain-containing protein n=1 Tax=Goekera deserti TaxID=2497753 RepID=A0A7K3WB31_9ACTN|nr:hypothetical protein [Goekera deserti]MPQ97580.1 hypothetical protein [Goekera deserti]NDI47816.1 hypothetical protein [Goekera deserti]NEL53564.1 hypothetical protein [Goekera deserti]